MGVLITAHGLYMGTRHSSLHVWRDVGQGFAAEILGAHTYVWSAFIFWVAVVLMGLLLVSMQDGAARAERRDLEPLGRAAAAVFLLAVTGNVVQALMSTGPPPYMGQSDPIRLCSSPRDWVWSLEEWQPGPISWRGRYDVEKPSLAGLETDARKGPLAGLTSLSVKRQVQLPPLNGPVADLAYEASTDRFLVVTGRHGVYVFDGSLGRILRHTVVDAAFSVDLGRFAGAATPTIDARTTAPIPRRSQTVL